MPGPASYQGRMSDIVGGQGNAYMAAPQQGEDTVPGRITPGNITDLKTRPAVDFTDHEGKKATGTIYSITFQEDPNDPLSPWVLAPSIYDGKWHSGADAEARYRKTGLHLGIFGTLEENEAYARALSDQQGRR